jgi:hypothetical protein
LNPCSGRQASRSGIRIMTIRGFSQPIPVSKWGDSFLVITRHFGRQFLHAGHSLRAFAANSRRWRRAFFVPPDARRHSMCARHLLPNAILPLAFSTLFLYNRGRTNFSFERWESIMFRFAVSTWGRASGVPGLPAIPRRSLVASLHRSCVVPARVSTTPCLLGARRSTHVGHQNRPFSARRAASISVGPLPEHDMHIFDVNKCTSVYGQLPPSPLLEATKAVPTQGNVRDFATPYCFLCVRSL